SRLGTRKGRVADGRPSKTGMRSRGTGSAAAKHSWIAGAARSASFSGPRVHCGSGTLPAASKLSLSGSHKLVWVTDRIPARIAQRLALALNPRDVTIPDALTANAGCNCHLKASRERRLLPAPSTRELRETFVIRFVAVFSPSLPFLGHRTCDD